jgi:hypothetical protein
MKTGLSSVEVFPSGVNPRRVTDRMAPSSWIRVGALALLLTILAVKQLLINAFGGDRHLISGFVEVVVAAYIVITPWMIVARANSTQRPPDGIGAIAIVQACALLWWGIILVLGPGSADPLNRIAAFATDIFFTLVIWVPLAFLWTSKELRILGTYAVLLVSAVATMGIVQFFFPASSMPWLLQPDSTAYITGTVVGTTRVNGLVGNPIEFGVAMAVAFGMLYALWLERLSFGRALTLVIVLIGVLVAYTRAGWLVAGSSLVLLTRVRRLPMLLLALGAAAIATLTFLPSGYWTAYFDKPWLYTAADTGYVVAVSDALRNLNNNPLTGTGLGFEHGFASASKIDTDGFWWSLMLEGGLPGFLLTILVYLTGLVFFVRGMRSRVEAIVPWARCGAIGTVMLLGSAWIDSWIANQAIEVGFNIALGICIAGICVEWPAGRRAEPTRFQVAAAVGHGGTISGVRPVGVERSHGTQMEPSPNNDVRSLPRPTRQP